MQATGHLFAPVKSGSIAGNDDKLAQNAVCGAKRSDSIAQKAFDKGLFCDTSARWGCHSGGGHAADIW